MQSYSPYILELVEDEEFYTTNVGFREAGWKALLQISSYLPAEKIDEILALTFVEQDEYTFPHACAVMETLLPRLQPEQIQTIFTYFVQLVPQIESKSSRQAGCKILIQIIPYLSPNHIRAHFFPTLRLLQGRDENLSLAAYKLVSLLVPEMEVREIDKILAEIKKVFQNYVQSEIKNVETSETGNEIIAAVYRILTGFLPKLNDEQIFSVIPPLSLALWDNNVDHDKTIALANLIKEVLPRINFSSVHDSLFIIRPELMLVNLMHHYWQKNAYNKPVSGLIYSPNLSLFSGAFDKSPADIKPTEKHLP